MSLKEAAAGPELADVSLVERASVDGLTEPPCRAVEPQLRVDWVSPVRGRLITDGSGRSCPARSWPARILTRVGLTVIGTGSPGTESP